MSPAVPSGRSAEVGQRVPDDEAMSLLEGRLSPRIETLGAVVAFAMCDPVGILTAIPERGRPARTADTRTSRNHPVALRAPWKMMFTCCLARMVQEGKGGAIGVSGRDARVPGC